MEIRRDVDHCRCMLFKNCEEAITYRTTVFGKKLPSCIAVASKCTKNRPSGTTGIFKGIGVSHPLFERFWNVFGQFLLKFPFRVKESAASGVFLSLHPFNNSDVGNAMARWC
jgi:hypothetical protein